MLPLLLGFPQISFCLCAFNAAMTIIGSGPVGGGIVEVISAAAAVIMCASVGLGVQYGIFLAMQIVLVSVVCAICMLTRRSFAIGLLACSTAYGVPSLLSMKTSADKAGLSITDSMFAGVNGAVKENYINSAGKSVDPALAEKVFDLVEDALRTCMPAIVIISAIIMGYAVMWMVSRALRSTPLNNGHSFGNIRFSYSAAAYAVVMILLLLIPNGSVQLVAINGLIISIFFAYAAGLSLADFLMRQKLPNNTVRIFIHIAIILFGSFIPAVIYPAAGIVDCFISIRKKVKTADEKK